MNLKQQAWFIMQLCEEGYIAPEQASKWAGKMHEVHDYEKLDPETREALDSVEILDLT